MTFQTNHTYTAHNNRTGETFNVKCIRHTVNGVTFIDNNNGTYNGLQRESAYTQNVTVLDVRKHVTIQAA